MTTYTSECENTHTSTRVELIKDTTRVCSQFSDTDVMARSAKDGGGDQKGPDWHELHQVSQQPGRPTDRVRTDVVNRNPEAFQICHELKSR